MKASQALFYEITMLNACAETYHARSGNGILFSQFTQNILIESFCVHLRNLMEFFVKRKPKPKSNHNRITHHYFMCPNQEIAYPHDLYKEYDTDVNNLLSHLTFERLNYNRKDSQWDLSHIAHEVNENFRLFLDTANHELLCDNLRNLHQSRELLDTRLFCTTSEFISPGTLLSACRGPGASERTFKKPR